MTIMRQNRLESAHLFTPGRASYITSVPDGSLKMNLTEASIHRGLVAAQVFDEEFHSMALFAGGHPGVAQQWPAEHIPPIGKREANLMAHPLKSALREAGWTEEDIASRVKEQGDSDNSIGDVLASIKQGFLDPNYFHTNKRHGITLVCGVLQGTRFREILSKALDIEPKRIQRVDMRDVYGTPATEFRSKEPAAVALAKEAAAIIVNRYVLSEMRPGNIDDLARVEQRFKDIATKSTK